MPSSVSTTASRDGPGGWDTSQGDGEGEGAKGAGLAAGEAVGEGDGAGEGRSAGGAGSGGGWVAPSVVTRRAARTGAMKDARIFFMEPET